jgi:uncharacterized protein YunC (DUF1805 family)
MPINTTPLNVLSKGDTVVCTFTDETNTNLVILGSATKKNDIYAPADNGISIYTNNAARGLALTSPSEGRVIYLLDTDELQIYNGTEWITVIDTGNSENITASTLVATSASIGTLTVTGPSTLTVLGSSNLSSSTTIGTITPTELGYLDGVTSGIQAQINLKAPSASPTFTGTVVLPDGTVTSSMILDGTIVNADINSAASIAYSKLNLATSIVNGDISASAAIAYSKLNLATSIVNGDISASAAIALSKLATTGTITATTFVGALTGNASSATSAGSVPASGITGQTGMWTSAARPGPYRMYRRDSDDAYNVQTYWTGVRWRLYGYLGDTAHADTHVGYSDSSGNSGTVAGLAVHSGRNNEANKVVRTQENGYILCGYINSSSGNEGNNSSPSRVWGTNGSDDYLRSYLTSALNAGTATNLSGGTVSSSGDITCNNGDFRRLTGTIATRTGVAAWWGSATDGGYLGKNTPSSLRYKTDVTEVINPLLDPKGLLDVNIVQFKYKDGILEEDDPNEGKYTIGFIAEDMYEKYQVGATIDEQGRPEAWNYNTIIPAMMSLIKDLYSRIEDLESNGAN